MEPDITQAKQLLQKEIQDRVNRCSEKIIKALQEENCKLNITMLVTEQGNLPQVKVVPLAEQQPTA